MTRCTHGFKLGIIRLNLSHRVTTPSVETGTLPIELLLQLETVESGIGTIRLGAGSQA